MANQAIRILVVEDDLDDFVLTSDILSEARRFRAIPIHVERASEAIEAMLSVEHEICLLDYRLGLVDGIEVLRGARAQHYAKPAIMLTGQQDDELADEALLAGASDFLEKARLNATVLERTIWYALERKRSENEILRLNAELERRVEERTSELTEAIRELQGFSYTVAHDLRAPLRAIISSARILREDFGAHLPYEAARELDRQADAASRLGTLIDDLLHYARLYRAPVEQSNFDFSEMAADIASELRTRDWQGSPIVEVEPGLTACGDSRLVRMVLGNLIENALKFSPNGGTITVGQSEGAFFVRDQGVGFNMSFVAKIFLPFERLVTEKEFPGTGIGLANVARIVKRHGGRIWADSAPGQGSTFYFTLPCEA